jgi:hypothetical protein
MTRTIEDCRSHLEDTADKPFFWVTLASECMAEATWLVDGEMEPEYVLDQCRRIALMNLKSRADRLQAKVLAGQAQSRVAP